MSIVDVLNPELAFRRLEQDKRDDVWPDIIGYRDYRLQLAENIELLKSKVAQPQSYHTQLPLEIDIPKKGFTLRPGVVPLIDDRLVYQSLADLLAPYFEPEPCVYSNRMSSQPDSPRMFIPGVELWLQLQDKVESLCDQYRWVVITDITAYDHINQDLMLHRLEDLFQAKLDRTVLNDAKLLLKRLWGRWSTVTRFGIPQVNDASSYLLSLAA